jgi:hypothetical protein
MGAMIDLNRCSIVNGLEGKRNLAKRRTNFHLKAGDQHMVWKRQYR